MFVADAMLLKLARWLRILGAETLYPEDSDDDALLEFAKAKKAVLLTQDVELSQRAGKKGVQALLVPRDISVEEQAAFVLKKFNLSIQEFPSRTLCPKCNGSLKVVSAEEVKGKVHEDLLQAHSSFWLCGSCGQVYWEGSHWRKIVEGAERIRKLLGA